MSCLLWPKTPCTSLTLPLVWARAIVRRSTWKLSFFSQRLAQLLQHPGAIVVRADEAVLRRPLALARIGEDEGIGVDIWALLLPKAIDRSPSLVARAPRAATFASCQSRAACL